MSHHLPPQCIEEEERLLDLLESGIVFIRNFDYLEPDDFYRVANRERFKKLIESDPWSESVRLAKKIKFMAEKRQETQESQEKITTIYERFGISEYRINK